MVYTRMRHVDNVDLNYESCTEYFRLSVACVPENLEANLICSNNVASMSWSYSRGGQLYVVRAVGTNGHVSECSSPYNRCDLTDLLCGEQYTATVTGEDIRCKSKPSDSVKIKTGTMFAL